MDQDPQRPEQTAQERRKSQEEALTVLLKQNPAPLAPDWFEAKTLARLRREREGEGEAKQYWGLGLSMPWRWVLGGVTAVGVLALSIVLLDPVLKSGDKMANSEIKTELNHSAESDRLMAALDAFASYSEDVKDWNQELF